MKIDVKRMMENIDTIKLLCSLSDQDVEVEFVDQTLTMNRSFCVVHLHFWWILVKRGISVTSDIVFERNIVSMGDIAGLLTKIYDKVLDTDSQDPKIMWDMFMSINELNNFIMDECAGCHQSMSLIELIDLLDQPRIKAIKDKIDFNETTPTAIVEKKLKVLSDELITALKDPTVENNVLYMYHVLGLINTMQVPQMLLAVGARTDINDDLIRWPIKSNLLEGCQNILDYACESLAAKKVAAYLTRAVADAQYFNRTCVLATSAIQNVYPGDCGSTVTIPFLVYRGIEHHLIGAHYIEDGVTKLVTEDNYEAITNKVINLRSPITCRHADGCCHACGGKLIKYLTKGVKLGPASTLQFTDPVTQKILSAKHLQVTVSLSYNPPAALKNIMKRHVNVVVWKSGAEKLMRTHSIGVPIGDLCRISDLHIINNPDAINEEHFSMISTIMIRDDSTGQIVQEKVNMENNKIKPFFHKDFLLYIKQNLDRLEIDDTVWIPLDKLDFTKPIFSSIVKNDSMILFVKDATRFLETSLKNYTSVTEALKDFTNLIYSKVSANILHLTVMLKACMIQSDDILDIPVVTDPDKVKFMTTRKLVLKRSYGPFFAYERIKEGLQDPVMFVVPKRSSMFDQFVGFSDLS